MVLCAACCVTFREAFALVGLFDPEIVFLTAICCFAVAFLVVTFFVDFFLTAFFFDVFFVVFFCVRSDAG